MPNRLVWIGLAIAAAVLLAIGSVHHTSSSSGAREAYLDSILKCPSCEDLSIAQSEAPSAVTLRHEVAHWVREGWSNGRIEAVAVSRYGQAELLLPESSGTSAALYILPVALIGCAALALGWHLYGRRRTRGDGTAGGDDDAGPSAGTGPAPAARRASP